MTSDDLTDAERALFGAYDVTHQLAAACGKLRDMRMPRAERPLDLVINCLMTELWDRCFTQTQIREAFTAALADMDRYAAGEEQRP